MAEYHFPHKADGIYAFDRLKDENGAPIPGGGSGEMTWYRGSTPIAGQAWPAPVVWNGVEDWYGVEIHKECETTLGEWLRGEVFIDAPNGKRYFDILRAQVRTPSSSS